MGDHQNGPEEFCGILHEFVIYWTLFAVASWIMIFLFSQTLYTLFMGLRTLFTSLSLTFLCNCRV